jgi:hypothetical protein
MSIEGEFDTAIQAVALPAEKDFLPQHLRDEILLGCRYTVPGV